MTEVRCAPGTAARHPSPAIAVAPERRRAATDLKRLLPYLIPYRTRWIVIVVAATASLVATVGIPIMTRAVIDGPVRHHDQRGLWVLGSAAMGLGLCEAGMLFIRRWLTAHATMGVEADIRRDLHARLQILPMSFHQRWQSGQLVSRIMNDLGTIRDLLSFGAVFMMLNLLQITVVTVCLLVMYWPLGLVVLGSIVPIVATVLHYQGSSLGCRVRCRTRPATSQRMSRSRRWAATRSWHSGAKIRYSSSSTRRSRRSTTLVAARCR
ncbi:hypothetical protein NIIDMKKI_09660 [Mycobacterium kansasii]|uniref:ABC transmembrane type-1 domain-containing protein n=1 Tax=Mycobacterium kansasii TaxID=1768 RepID=A0A7G1I419_MYCKA|nr:hypothetical protein NIIDMKKI_09660 [Mycobacterium kansasii]